MKSAEDHIGDMEFLPPWEGQAIHSPGMLLEIPADGSIPEGIALPDLAGWVAVTAFCAETENPASKAIKAKAKRVLANWRLAHGAPKLAELKQCVTDRMELDRPNGKLTSSQLRQRFDSFFSEISE